MNEETKELLEEIKHQFWHLVHNTQKKDGFDMIVWAFALGQHSIELKQLKEKLAYYLDNIALNDGKYSVKEEDLKHIFNRLDFISVNMVP